MSRYALIAALAAGCLALTLTSQASYLEEEQGPGTVEPMPVVEPPRPVPDNPLIDVVRRLSVRPPYTYRGLTVWPVLLDRPTDRTGYLSLEEALEDEVLVIREKGGGTVPILLAENVGRRPILMLAGEVLAGGKQNRTLQEDVLLPRRSGPVELPVYCVERSRWSGRDEAFKANPSVAALNVRALAQAGAPQAEIWGSVSGYQTQLEVQTETGDLQAVYDQPEVRRALEGYRDAFRRRWPGETVGMVVARYGTIVGADIFCNARVFARHRDRLLESYAVDCYALWREREGELERYPVPVHDDAWRFLRRAYRAHYRWQGTPGAGRLLRVEGAGLSGMGLVYEGALLHAALFPEQVIVAPPVPPIRPLPQRRQLIDP